MRLEKFKENLLKNDVSEIYSQCLTDSDVWFFRNKLGGTGHQAKYDSFKQYMAKKLDIQPNNIAIVGSAKLGFSLSPTKAFRTFSENSDIDIVIVSESVFRQSWNAFLELNKRAPLRSYKAISSEIFRRFVTLKTPDTSVAFFDDWSKKVDPCKRDLQIFYDMPNDINYRIYDSWDSVQAYHELGLNQLKKGLENSDEKNN